MIARRARRRAAAGAVVLAAGSLAAPPVSAADGYSAVRSLVVQYEDGRSPGPPGSRPAGSARVDERVRALLVTGPELGFGMWRIDFTRPVRPATAREAARDLTASRLIVIAEVDGVVTVQQPPRR